MPARLQKRLSICALMRALRTVGRPRPVPLQGPDRSHGSRPTTESQSLWRHKNIPKQISRFSWHRANKPPLRLNTEPKTISPVALPLTSAPLSGGKTAVFPLTQQGVHFAVPACPDAQLALVQQGFWRLLPNATCMCLIPMAQHPESSKAWGASKSTKSSGLAAELRRSMS